MPRILKTTAVGLLTMMMLGAGAFTAVATQVSPEELLIRLDGLETAYARKYIADRELGFVTPAVANGATPDVMLVSVLEFQDAATATDAFDTMMNGLVARALMGVPDLRVDEREIDGLGDDALLYSGAEETDDGTEHHALLAVRDGNLGMLIEAEGEDGAIVETIQRVAAFMVAQEPGDDPVSVDESGATGGTFEIMPTMADADVLGGLIPMYDYDLLLNGGTEPLGHIHEEATPAD